MLVSDALGNAVTASSSESVALLDDTVTAYLGFRTDTGDRLKALFAAAPDLVLAHCLRGYFMMLFGQRAMVPRAHRSLEAAQRAAQGVGVTPREAAHVATLAAWVAGDFAGATARWEAIAGEHPRDVLALKLAQYGCFYAGESQRMRDVLAHALPAWDAAMPGYGFVLGCHSFGLEETGDYAAAEYVGRDAVERNPADIWAAHAVAHVFEMTGRAQEGIDWINRLEGNWSDCNNFAYHTLWHRCLFLMELGAVDRVLDLYDCEVRPESTDDLLDISNAVSLLWRLEQEGVDVGQRWEELGARSQTHLDDHLLTFGDVHYLIALAAASRPEDTAGMVASLSHYAQDSGETEAAVAREPGLARARAVLARNRGDHAATARELAAVRDRIWRIGGSHAQRDLFEEMLIDSALRAGETEEARALLAERLQRRPRNAWGWRHFAKALSRLGDDEGASSARERAAELVLPHIRFGAAECPHQPTGAWTGGACRGEPDDKGNEI
jgi:tetratricopeptide (TPR) repeat protein